MSEGRKIRVETFIPRGGDSGASLLVLHGATGVAFANRFIAGLSELFARQGFVVHLVHYFDRTGTIHADDTAIPQLAAPWSQTVADAVAWIHAQCPAVRIGLFGYSLGGHLAAVESVRNPRVNAAVILAAGLENAPIPPVLHAPPFLFLHGAADTRVPIGEARQWEQALALAGGNPEFHVYPDEEHLLSLPCYADVVRRGTEFFGRHLLLPVAKDADK